MTVLFCIPTCSCADLRWSYFGHSSKLLIISRNTSYCEQKLYLLEVSNTKLAFQQLPQIQTYLHCTGIFSFTVHFKIAPQSWKGVTEGGGEMTIKLAQIQMRRCSARQPGQSSFRKAAGMSISCLQHWGTQQGWAQGQFFMMVYTNTALAAGSG